MSSYRSARKLLATSGMCREAIKVPSWLTKRFVLSLVFALTVGPGVTALLLTMGDQWIRNLVDDWMSGPDLFDSLSIRPDQYQGLPLRWRQALSEIAVRDSDEVATLQQLVKTLDVEQIGLLDRIAPYVLDIGGAGGIVRHRTVGTYPHLIPGVPQADFGVLETLGVIESSGYTTSVPSGTLIPGTGTALVVSLTDPDQTLPVHYTRLTDVGTRLMSAVGRHTDLAYLEWVARKLEQDAEATVALWAIEDSREGSISAQLELTIPSGDVAVINRTTISALPAEE